MSKIKQPKIPVDIITVNYKLVREGDGLTLTASTIKWIQWKKNGQYSKSFPNPAVGRSLLFEPNRINYTWLTTPVTEIIEQKEGYIKFRTKNSIYELEIYIKLKDEYNDTTD